MVLAKARPLEDRDSRINTQNANAPRTRAKPGALRSGCPTMLQLGATAIISVALLLSYLSLHMQAVKVCYDLTIASRQLDRLKSEHERLSLAAAQLRSLARIEEDARTRLGMREPGDIRMIAVDIAPAQAGQQGGQGRLWDGGKPGEEASPAGGVSAAGAPHGGPLATAGYLGERISGSIMGLASQFIAKWFFDLPSSQLSGSGARG
ncbi:MAG: hypothetical protein HPY71_05260 [Firmicutes bacterium]|nr:hypothetical protein [Bacillota bacterium]